MTAAAFHIVRKEDKKVLLLHATADEKAARENPKKVEFHGFPLQSDNTWRISRDLVSFDQLVFSVRELTEALKSHF